MKIDDSLYWYFDRSVGAEFFRGYCVRLNSGFCGEFVSGCCEEVVLEVGSEVGCRDGSSSGKFVNKYVKDEFNLNIDYSLDWYVNRSVGARFL